MPPPSRLIPKLKNVAAAAGVSTSTVSRYLNRTLVLPPSTASRIDAAVAELGYTPDANARRLSLGRTDVIALIIPDIANPFFARLADAIQQAAEAEGFELLISTTRNRPARECADLGRMRRDRADGVIFVTNHADDGSLARLIDAGHPTVLLDEDVAGTSVPKLFVDNRAGGRMAAEHLVAHGHRHLAILGGPPGLLSTAERHGGFHDAAMAAGCCVTFEDFSGYSAIAGRAAAHRMLDSAHPPSAVFATSDETALGLLDAAHDRGLRIPDVLSVVAFDDIGPWHLLDPPLTAIRQPVEELATGGVQLLLAVIRNQPARPARRLRVELIERYSVAPPAPSHGPSIKRQGER